MHDIPPVAIDLIPEPYCHQVLPALRLERHDEPSACAIRIKGYAHDDQPCFYFYSWTLMEERFDCEDSAYLLATYSEWMIAWRLKSGQWVRQKRQIDRLKQPYRQQDFLHEFEILDKTDMRL